MLRSRQHRREEPLAGEIAEIAGIADPVRVRRSAGAVLAAG
jgi:hypothetical protein